MENKAGGMLKKDLEEAARKKLEPGETYTFYRRAGEEDARKKHRIKIRMELIECHTHHAVFRDKNGFLRAFQHWSIDRMLRGIPMEG